MIEAIKSNKAQTNELESLPHSEDAPLRRISLLRRMRPWSGATYSEVPLWRLVISPFLISINPAVMWATLTISFPVLWIVGISLVIAQLFSAPPYLMSPEQIGYMQAGPLVSACVANLLCAFLSDWSVKWLSRRNGGRYEPEFRLFLLSGLVISAALGYFLFGYLISLGESPVVMSVIYGIVVAGAQFSAVTVGAYMVDAYRAISVDVFIIGMVFKNFLYFGFSCKWWLCRVAKASSNPLMCLL
jgi:hypothetical protein